MASKFSTFKVLFSFGKTLIIDFNIRYLWGMVQNCKMKLKFLNKNMHQEAGFRLICAWLR